MRRPGGSTRRIRRCKLAGVALVAYLTLGLLLAIGAAAETASFTSPGCTPWAVPSGLRGPMRLRATGAAGQEFRLSFGSAAAGSGDTVTASFAVPAASKEMYVCVDVGGGSGHPDESGAGGGAAGVSLGSNFGQPVLVAGGGGGGGEAGNGGGAGESGMYEPWGGGGASSTGPGAGGEAGSEGYFKDGPTGYAGSDGTSWSVSGPGSGGEGGAASFLHYCEHEYSPGGGGGGGYYGGGGGGGASCGGEGGGGGGGGGSDFCAATLRRCRVIHGSVDTSGSVELTYQTRKGHGPPGVSTQTVSDENKRAPAV